MRFDDVRAALYPDTGDAEDFSHERVLRLLAMVRGDAVATRGTQGIEVFSGSSQLRVHAVLGR